MRPLLTGGVTRTVLIAAMFATVVGASTASAQGRFRGGQFQHFRAPQGPVIIHHDYRAPYYWGAYPWGWGWGYPYGYGVYTYGVPRAADVKTDVTPKQAEVYVDGYYAGIAEDFNGAFKQLHTSPGGHTVTLRLDGYRTMTENIYVRRDSTFKLHETLTPLAPGEVTGPAPLPELSRDSLP